MDLSACFSCSADLSEGVDAFDWRVLPASDGVYALVDGGGRLLLMVGVESMRRSVKHRLRGEVDGARSKRADLGAVARRIWWQPTFSAFETSLIYLQIARRVWPDAYRKQLSFGPVWFAVLDESKRWPQWRVSSVGLGNGVDAGPFATKKKCAALVSFLEDAFDLCRYYDVLEKAPFGAACDYFDMGRCPGPCDGTISHEQYDEMIEASRRFAIGEVSSVMDDWRSRMVAAAAGQHYEAAARFKELIERAGKTRDDAGRFATCLDSFRYVVIQKAEGRGMVKPWFVAAGGIEEGAAVSVEDAAACWPAWALRAKEAAPAGSQSMVSRSEQAGLVCHFLGKGARAGGLFLPVDDGRYSEDIARLLEAGF